MEIPKGMLDKLEEIVDLDDKTPLVSRAPGRVEVLGNHTDYNGGVVLAAPIDRFVWCVGVPSETPIAHSMDFEDTKDLSKGYKKASTETNWDEYVRGVYWAFFRRKHKVRFMTAVIKGNVPIGAGLSSSAALEVSMANLLASTSSKKMHPKALAMIAFEAERLYCKIACGIMDQFTSQLGKKDSLIGIYCSNLVTKTIPLPTDVKLVITDSMVSRAASDALNERRNQCKEALQTLKASEWPVEHLSEISSGQLPDVKSLLDDTLYQRVKHVVEENSRAIEGIASLQTGRIEEFGQLMYKSHESSKKLYEVSHPRLDLLVEIARNLDGVIGSRMTGAGLGGAILSVVKSNTVDSFVKAIQEQYESETNMVPTTMVCDVPDGAIVTQLNDLSGRMI